jgi:hypothetical protein
VSAFLATWYEEGFQVPTGVTLKTVGQSAVDRLATTTALAEAALEIPRRLGNDATGGELAKDKIRCRRVMHVVKKTTPGWSNYKPHKVADMKMEAAVLDWIAWFENQTKVLRREMNIIAALHFKSESPAIDCKQALMWTNNEYRWLAYALRD